MKLTRSFVFIGSTFWLPLLGLAICSAMYVKPALSQSFNEHRKQQESMHRPLEGMHRETPSQAQTAASEERRDRIHHHLPIESIRATLDIRAESNALRSLQIFDPEMEKDAFTFSLRHAITRTPASEFSLSLGFSYLDESLAFPPPSPPGSGPPTPRMPPPSPNIPSSRPDSLPSPEPLQTADILSGPPVSADRQSDARRTPMSGPPAVNVPGPPPSDGFSNAMRTGVLQFAQNYRHRDASGRWLARSQFNLGTELVNSPETMNADAQFFSWTGRLERTQIINNNHQLTLQLETQLSPNNLLPAHQFKMKDRRFADFERDGRPSEIAGNNGVRLRLEDRIPLTSSSQYLPSHGPPSHTPPSHAGENRPSVALIPFVDMGYTWGQSNPEILSEQFLGRAGLGLSVQPLPELDIRFDYLRYWGNFQAESNDQDLYITVGYQNAW